MDKYTKECLDGFKGFIDDQFVHFTLFNFGEYSKVYPFTNERINKQLGLVNLDITKRALTVLSSGDHAFNLAYKGVSDIDTFDINRLTEYYALGLKRTLILESSYKEFLEFIDAIVYQRGYRLISEEEFKRNKDYVSQSIFDLSCSMDQNYRDFWRGVLDYFSSVKKYWDTEIFYCIFRGRLEDLKEIKENNGYASNEYLYNLLKEKLGSANIRFRHSTVLDLSRTYDGNEYEFISLSNTLDYMSDQFGQAWGIDRLNCFINNIKHICSPQSIIFLTSILSKRCDEVVSSKTPVFRDSSVYKGDLDDLELHILPGPKPRQGVVLKKIISR